MANIFFITGTDTEIGKTFSSCALLKALDSNGKKVVGLKPIAAGAQQVDGQWLNEDADALMSASNIKLPYERVNPFCFKSPVAPHIAAEQEGRPLTVESVVETVKSTLNELVKISDTILIEGAGGFLVPLNQKESFADLIEPLGAEIILVVGMKLGCINHALLTIEAIKSRGLKCRGWIANQLQPDMMVYQENKATLERSIEYPLLAEIGYQTSFVKLNNEQAL